MRKTYIIVIICMLVMLHARSQSGQVLHFVDSGSIHLRWNGVQKSFDGYKIYRRKAGETEWRAVSNTIIKPVYSYNELNRLLGYKTAAYLRLLGVDPNLKSDLTPAILSRIYSDRKAVDFLGAMSMVNPEYGFALGQRYEDRIVQRGESYEYRVAYLENGIEKEWAKTSVINSAGIMAVPSPKDLKATGLDAAVGLEWKKEPELMRNATVVSYKVYRSEDLLGPYQPENFYGTISVSINNQPSATESFRVQFLENGKTYYFTIKAVNAFGVESAATPVVEATPRAGTIPFVTGLTIVSSGKQARLNWDQPAVVEVYRSANRENFTRIYPPVETTLPAIKILYDRNVNEGNEYRYFVKIVNSDVTSDTVKWLLPDATPPLAPKNIKATARKGSIVLQWEANRESDLLGYEVERASDALSKTRFLLTSKPITPNNFTDTLDYRSQTVFGYVVYAVDKNYNRSKPSELVKIKMPDHLPPAAPYIISLQRSDQGVDLRWTSAREPDIAKYIVYSRRSPKGSFVKIADVSAFQYTGAISDAGEHFFSVSAIDSTGNESAKSNEVKILIPDESAIKPPVNGIISLKNGNVLLQWQSAPNSKPDGFVITRIEPGGKILDIAQTGANTREYTDVFPVKGRLTYQIRTRNEKWKMGKPLVLQIDIK